MGRTIYSQVLRDWDWDGLVRDATDNGVGWVQDYLNDGGTVDPEGFTDGYPDRMYGSTFMGTVFAVLPSGKYYTPWANSKASSSPSRNRSINWTS